MSIRSNARLVLIGLVLASPSALWKIGAQQAAPPRDASAPVVKYGTASISGRVVADTKDAEPLRRVHVTVAELGARMPARVTVTDDSGRFDVSGLVAGRYQVTATKAPYLPGAHGLTRPVRAGSAPAGTAISLAEGEVFTNVSIRLARGAVLTGVVRGADGQPVRGASVAVAHFGRDGRSGTRVLMGSGNATTDATGTYRVFGLAPGEYIVGSFAAQAGHTEKTTPADLDGPPAVSSRRRPHYAFVPIYYPGTQNAAEATRIAVGPGEERSGLDLRIAPIRSSVVDGTVQMPDGSPAGRVAVRLVAHVVGSNGGPFGLTNWTTEGGTFRFTGVAPGRYSLRVTPELASKQGNWGAVDVNVSEDADVQATLTLRPTLSISGRVEIEAGSAGTALAGARVWAFPEQDWAAAGSAPVASDGTFTLPSLMPAAYRLTTVFPATAKSTLVVKRATLGGNDALDSAVLLDGSAMEGVVLLSDRVSELAGTIQDATGKAATEFFLIVFPVDRSLWSWGSRRIQQARPSSDGQFMFRNLPAGEYRLAAVTDVEQNQWFEQAFLETIHAAAVTVKVTEGEKTIQNIRLR